MSIVDVGRDWIEHRDRAYAERDDPDWAECIYVQAEIARDEVERRLARLLPTKAER
jgi:hypothetical protein